MKGKLKRAAALLIVCVLVFGLGVGVFADSNGPLDLTNDCGLTVSSSWKDDGYPAPDKLVVDIYRVATAEAVADEDNYVLIPYPENGPFKDVDFTDDRDEWRYLTQELAKIVLLGDHYVSPYIENAEFEKEYDVPAGLYLIIPHQGDTSNPEDYVRTEVDDNGNMSIITTATANNGANDFYFSPMLMHFPLKLAENNWEYDRTVYFKAGYHTHKPDIDIIKVSEGTNTPLPGAKFKLYCAIPPVPENELTGNEEKFDIYVQGMGNVTMYFWPSSGITADEYGQYITGRNGKIIIERPDVPPYTLFALKEVEAPEGYAVKNELTYFYLGNNGDESLGVIDMKDWEAEWNDTVLNWRNSDYGKVFEINVPDNLGYVYVRAKVISNCSILSLSGNGSWEPGDGGYYYLHGVVFGPNETIAMRVDYAGDEEEESDFINMIVSFEVASAIDEDGKFTESPDWENIAQKIPIEDPVQYKYAAKAAIKNSDGNYSVTVENTPNEILVDLPGIGGVGTTVFYTAGGMMIVSALALMTVKKRSRSG